MQGVPYYGLRTRTDYERLLGLALKGEIRAQGVATLKRHWEGLLAGRWCYIYDRDLTDNGHPDGEMPDYRVFTEQHPETGHTRRLQMKRIESPQAEIFRLGFTVRDVEQVITDLEAL